METREIETSVLLGTTAVKCLYCDDAFVIIYIPIDIDDCNGEISDSWWILGNSDFPLYCPLCGKKMVKETESKSL